MNNSFDTPTHNINRSDSEIDLALPIEIGPYKIIRQLGAGGMGQVFLGQSAQPKRQAAIKLLLPTSLKSEAMARFEREMEALARLEHIGIARLFESGVTLIDGVEQPWYAMEYVDGLALDEYVKRNALSVNQIFELTAKIARALHYAHQRGVIHRDIKPANILVGQNHQAKILDFGIAQLNAGNEASGFKTRFGQIIGTLAYMSPEQVSSSDSVDVRSDVYALGIVLYQLLSGQLPLTISTTSLLDAIKEITEGKRQSLSSHQPKMRGEVELIVDTASHRDIERRYDSAASFADDLERFRQHQPLHAKRPSWRYVFGKFVRRNPFLVGAVSIAILSLIASTWWSIRAAGIARKAELTSIRDAEIARLAKRDADTRADEMVAMNDFLVDDLVGAALEVNGMDSGNITVYDAMLEALKNAPNRFRDQPDIESNVQMMMGMIIGQHGNRERALVAFERARDLRLKTTGPHSDGTLEARIDIGNSLLNLRRLDEAEVELQEVAKIADQYLPTPHMTQARAHHYLALSAVFGGRGKDAVLHAEKALALARETLPKTDKMFLAALNNLARAYRVDKQYERAAPLFEETLALRIKILGIESGQVAETRNDIAKNYQEQGHPEKALPIFLGLLKDFEKSGTSDSIRISVVNHYAGQCLAAMQQHQAAIKHFDLALLVRKPDAGAKDSGGAMFMGGKGMSLLALNRLPEARLWLQRALKAYDEFAPNHPQRALAAAALAQTEVRAKTP